MVDDAADRRCCSKGSTEAWTVPSVSAPDAAAVEYDMSRTNADRAVYTHRRGSDDDASGFVSSASVATTLAVTTPHPRDTVDIYRPMHPAGAPLELRTKGA